MNKAIVQTAADLSAVICRHLAEWLQESEIQSAQDICSGYCCDFADPIYFECRESGVEILALDTLEDAEDLAVSDAAILQAIKAGFLAHTFLRFQGLYFDAEAPQGVSHPLLLPTYQRALVEGMEAGLISMETLNLAQTYCHVLLEKGAGHE